ncbi:MAG: type III pantothenate kinase [Deltaproteobacteria bacterium]|nr:type III pantothenate kinase [Deltaproteobacteria bacterium]MBM4317000.1 type III pantothenate kinase [Deltaproteobacteria bacterium]
MLLVMDIGNSQTSYGIFDQSKLTHHWRGETKSARSVDEYAAFLFPLLNYHHIKAENISGIAISSVVPPCDYHLKRFCEEYLENSPFFVSCENKAPFTIRVDNPREVGADRLANTAYAVTHLKLPAIVVDLGTATTFDVVSDEKSFEGGIILPGIVMGAESLSLKTSLLPLVPTDFPKSVIGKNTVTCIQSGILFGYCEAIDGLLSRLQKEIGKKCDIALTGGIAPLIHSHLKTPSLILPHLTLEGIKILYEV